MATMATMEERFLAVLVALEPGEVVSYGDVAEVAGYPGRSRAVGRLLATTALDVPWWRVVRSDGRLAAKPSTAQAGLLRAEGVVVRGGRVVASPGGRFRGDPAGPATRPRRPARSR
jgi:methylated-DNA-protein-cysteine methyltransferase-like protein